VKRVDRKMREPVFFAECEQCLGRAKIRQMPSGETTDCIAVCTNAIQACGVIFSRADSLKKYRLKLVRPPDNAEIAA